MIELRCTVCYAKFYVERSRGQKYCEPCRKAGYKRKGAAYAKANQSDNERNGQPWRCVRDNNRHPFTGFTRNLGAWKEIAKTHPGIILVRDSQYIAWDGTKFIACDAPIRVTAPIDMWGGGKHARAAAFVTAKKF